MESNFILPIFLTITQKQAGKSVEIDVFYCTFKLKIECVCECQRSGRTLWLVTKRDDTQLAT